MYYLLQHFSLQLFCLSYQCLLLFFLHTSEQGRRNDLHIKKLRSSVPLSTDQHLPPPLDVSSDSVHCNALTQSSTVSYAFSCHTTDTCGDGDVESSSTEAHIELNDPNPSWVHVFSKTNSTSSLRTQCASSAYMTAQSSKVLHRRSRRAKKKKRKIEEICREIMVRTNQFKLTPFEIDTDIVVFDGGNHSTPRIKPPDGIFWRSISVKQLHVEDETDPNIGLTHPMIDGVHPFIRMPRSMSLGILDECGLLKITKSLSACEKLRRRALTRGDAKRVFTDYGKVVHYACVGPQVSRNSKTVLNHPPYMDALPDSHWRSLVWMMKCAERSFCSIADHTVLSHIHHAKKVVPFKRFTSSNDNYNAQFFGGIAFGTNVFLRCHTDADFTFSIIQVFLKGKLTYLPHDEIVVYFCFPTLGVAVPLRPGDYLLFNARIPHCISSRCKLEDEIMCTSTYLKTAIVGMNNNDLPLTDDQALILDNYKSKK